MHKPIVVLDTNIFISSIFWEGKPYKIIQKALDKEFKVFISEDILKELARVLSRDFELEKQEINDVLDSIIMFTNLIKPNEKINHIKDDPDDNRILECATACKAKYIISQDKHLLNLEKFRNVKILNPIEFLKKVE